MDIDKIAKEAIKNINIDLEEDALEEIKEDTNLYEIIDSFSLVNLVIETEELIESDCGSYYQLASDELMDATKTPFKSYKKWVAHITTVVEG